MSVELRFENVFTGCSTCNAEPGECTCAEQRLDPEERYEPTAILGVGVKRAACWKCKGSGLFSRSIPCNDCPSPSTELREGLPRLVEASFYCEKCIAFSEVDHSILYPEDPTLNITNHILRIQPWEGWREDLLAALQERTDANILLLPELTGLGITLEILPCQEPGCEDLKQNLGTKKPCPRCGQTGKEEE